MNVERRLTNPIIYKACFRAFETCHDITNDDCLLYFSAYDYIEGVALGLSLSGLYPDIVKYLLSEECKMFVEEIIDSLKILNN